MLHHYIEYVTWGFATQCEERETRRSITCVLFWNFPPFHLSFSGPCRHFPGSSVKFLRFCSLVTLLAERRLGMNSSPTIPPPSTDRIVKQHADTCEYLQSSTTRRRKWGLWEVQFVLAIWKSSLRTMTSFDDGRQPAKPIWGITKNLDRLRHQARRGPFLGIIYCEFMKISRLSSFPDELWSIFATVKALDLSVYIFCNDPSSWRFLWWSVPNRLSFPLMVLSDCFVCRSRHDSRDENRNMYLDPATTDS